MTATKEYYENEIERIIDDESNLDSKQQSFGLIKYKIQKDTELNINDKNHFIRYINNELVIIQDIKKEWLDLINNK